MRETDDYVERSDEGPPPEPRNPWARNVFQPVVVAVLVACVAWSAARLIVLLEIEDSATLFWLTPVLMAFIGFRTQRVVQKRFLSSSDSLRFRLIELGVMYLLIKLFSHFDETLPEMLAIARQWAQAPLTFFDNTSVIAFLMGTAAWWAAGATARDLDAVVDPTMYVGETEARTRLISRYFAGGALLIVLAALTRIDPRSVLTLTNRRLRTPIPNVLLYFFLGLVMLGQVQLARLSGVWQREKVRVASNLNVAWIRYLLLFVALAALLAFVLPTGYTIGILDLVATAIWAISYVVTLIYIVVFWPFAMLFALLMGQPDRIQPPAVEQLPLRPEPLPGSGAGTPWLAILRSLAFWVVLLAAIVYLLRSYVRDRPGLWKALQRFAPLRWLRAAWQALRHWITGVGETVQRTVPALVRRLRRDRGTDRQRRQRRRGPDAREQLLYHYLTTLDRAEEAGFPRRGTQTPYEYRETLDPHLAEGHAAMRGLTEAFVEARYSTHAVTEEEVAAQAANAAEILRALRHPREEEEEAPPSHEA